MSAQQGKKVAVRRINLTAEVAKQKTQPIIKGWRLPTFYVQEPSFLHSKQET